MGDVIALKRAELSAPATSDTLLMRALVRGDGDALGELFSRHHQKVYRFLARMAPLDHAHLDDMLQNTFIAARGSAHRFKGDAKVETWLLAIASNILKQHIRKETRRRVIAKIVAASAEDRVCDHTPEVNLQQQIMMRHLTKAVHQLSYKLKVVFVMCDLEGIPGCDVARMLNLREGTVWRRLHDARKQLRQSLSKHMEGNA